MKKAFCILIAFIMAVCFSSCKKEAEQERPEEIIDLTMMSRTMVYPEVYNMVNSPENYIGKTIKMKGLFSVVDGDCKRYFTCIITDATACCRQGMEFTLAGEHKYPDDYPEPGDEITVIGVFETYTDGKNKFCQIKDAEFLT
ncbi:MAG: hypothetical protein IJU45_04875 [Clostridia bacterium]|nr:hypothetical protein [Clostridia bacterium]